MNVVYWGSLSCYKMMILVIIVVPWTHLKGKLQTPLHQNSMREISWILPEIGFSDYHANMSLHVA